MRFAVRGSNRLLADFKTLPRYEGFCVTRWGRSASLTFYVPGHTLFNLPGHSKNALLAVDLVFDSVNLLCPHLRYPPALAANGSVNRNVEP